MNKFVLLLAALFLAGCASSSDKVSCLDRNWYAIGVKDGKSGAHFLRWSDHLANCPALGDAPAEQQYSAGRAEGLKQFCTPKRAVKAGRRGYVYTSTCPAKLHRLFVPAYELGRRIRKETYDLQRTERRMDDLQDALDDTETESGRDNLQTMLNATEEHAERIRKLLVVLKQKADRVR